MRARHVALDVTAIYCAILDQMYFVLGTDHRGHPNGWMICNKLTLIMLIYVAILKFNHERKATQEIQVDSRHNHTA